MDNYVDKIFALGDDQKANQFTIKFLNIKWGAQNIDNIALRVDQSFDIPNITTGEYEFYNMGEKFVRTSALNETDKHITFQIRLDQEGIIYSDLLRWKKVCHDASTATKGQFEKRFCDIQVDMYDGNRVVKLQFKLRYCECKELQISSFDPSSNDPSRATLMLTFGELVPARSGQDIKI